MSDEALGMIETKGPIGATEAVDAAIKVANAALIGYKKVGSGLVTVMVRGDVGVVKTPVDAGIAAADAVGGVVSYYVVPQSYSDMEEILPQATARNDQPDHTLAVGRN